MSEEQLIEKLADKEHASWSRWMEYLFSRCEKQPDGRYVISESDFFHWYDELKTPYNSLSEKVKESDRKEVAHILPIIKQYVSDLIGEDEHGGIKDEPISAFRNTMRNTFRAELRKKAGLK